MLSYILRAFLLRIGAENFSTSVQRNFKVTVIGAAGGIGQPLSLLLRLNELVTHLALFDISPITPGVAVDLAHMDMPACVTGHKGQETLSEAVKDSHIVVVPAGVPRKKLKMNRDDLFKDNANMMLNIAKNIAQSSPKAIIVIITNPVNSLVPLTYEVMKKAGVDDPRRILGVNTLDVVRAASFIGKINGIDPRKICIPVIGGHSASTIIPVLSQCTPPAKFKDTEAIEAFMTRIQDASTEVVAGKAGGGSATLSTAYAGARLCISVLRGLNGECNVVECTYVKSDVTEAAYFANPVLLGKNGVEKNLGYGKLDDYEKCLVKRGMPELLKNIKTGEDFAKNAC